MLGEPQVIFSETESAGNRNRKNRVPEGHRPNGPAELAAENCDPRAKETTDYKAHIRRKPAAGVRPPGGISEWALRALLTVALANLALRGQPVFGFMAGFKSAALREQVGEAADLFFHVNGNQVGPRLGPHDFRLFRGLSCF